MDNWLKRVGLVEIPFLLRRTQEQKPYFVGANVHFIFCLSIDPKPYSIPFSYADEIFM